MKKITKVATFMGLAGAALAGLWYFLKVNEEDYLADDCMEDSDEDEAAKKREYVTIEKFSEDGSEVTEEETSDDDVDAADAVNAVKGKAEEAIKSIKGAAGLAMNDVKDQKENLKKAVKSVAQDMIKKAEDKKKGVGLVKEEKETDDFSFEKFDE